MRFIAGIWRLAIAALCFLGTAAVWHHNALWAFLSVQVAVIVGVVMLWSAAASLLKGVQPPAWLSGSATCYAVVLGLGAWFLYPQAQSSIIVLSIAGRQELALFKIMPIMVLADFLLLQPHRRFNWQYPLAWLAYPALYLVFVVLRAWWWPDAGALYPVFDPRALGWGPLAANCLQFLALTLATGAVIAILDRALPQGASRL